MALAGEHHEGLSPYARAARDLIALGYHAIPLMPPGAELAGAGKAPGEYTRDRWFGMREWQRFRDRAPTEYELEHWMRAFPDANIGLVCGAPAGEDHVVIAVDLDAKDYDDVQFLKSALPFSPMTKKGAKGLTLFYRAPIAAQIRSNNYDKPTGRTKNGRPEMARVADLLTGADTRQTVAPPSVHPDGPIYAWLSGPVPAQDLPIFDAAALEKFEEALAVIGCIQRAARRERQDAPERIEGRLDGELDYWAEANQAALMRLGDWVPQLELYGLDRARRGYAAIAHWRSSSTGRPLAARKRNLSIQPIGIKDFGSGDTYSPIDLVMAAKACALDEATAWLRAALKLDEGGPEIAATLASSAPSPPARALRVVAGIDATWDADTGEIIEEHAPRVAEAELPAAMTRVTGLLGALTDWIADSARRPQRGLALGAALTIIGTAAGRVYGGPTRTGTQLYVLGVARTGAGKDHPLQQIGRVLRAADLARMVGPSQFMSMSAVINRVSRSPVMVAPIDEFASFLQRINSRKALGHEKAISGVMRQFWGASFQTVEPPEWAGRSLDPIHSPAFSIYGVATHEEFYESLQGGDVTNGFLNRFLLISTRVRPTELDPVRDGHAVPIDMREALADIAGAGNGVVTATSNFFQAGGPQITVAWRDRAAQEAYRAFGQEIEAREEQAAFYARTVEMAQRIATIKAVGDEPAAPRISRADIEWACALALWSADRMRAEASAYMAETQSQAEAQMILRVIREKGRISRRDLGRALQHKIKGRDLKDALDGLEASGEIAIERACPPSGGTPTIWYLITN